MAKEQQRGALYYDELAKQRHVERMAESVRAPALEADREFAECAPKMAKEYRVTVIDPRGQFKTKPLSSLKAVEVYKRNAQGLRGQGTPPLAFEVEVREVQVGPWEAVEPEKGRRVVNDLLEDCERGDHDKCEAPLDCSCPCHEGEQEAVEPEKEQ